MTRLALRTIVGVIQLRLAFGIGAQLLPPDGRADFPLAEVPASSLSSRSDQAKRASEWASRLFATKNEYVRTFLENVN